MGIVGYLGKWSTQKKMNAYGLLLFISASIPIWITLGIPLTVQFTTQGYYDAILAVPKGGVMVFGWQVQKFEAYIGMEDVAAAIWKLVHSRGIKVINLSLGPIAPLFFEDIYKRNKLVERYKLVYGEDYIITPNVPGEESAIAAFAADTWGTVSTDLYGNRIADLPLGKRVRTFNDVDLGWHGSYSAQNHEQFIRQWGWGYNKPLIMAFHSFSSVAYAYPFPEKGVIGTVREYAEFEFLTGYGGAEFARYEATSTIGVTALSSVAIGVVYYQIMKLRERTRAREASREAVKE